MRGPCSSRQVIEASKLKHFSVKTGKPEDALGKAWEEGHRRKASYCGMFVFPLGIVVLVGMVIVL